jgi:hypothetical protein
MRQRDKQVPQKAEETVRDIRRATRRHFSARRRSASSSSPCETKIAQANAKEDGAADPFLSFRLSLAIQATASSKVVSRLESGDTYRE